MAQSPPSNHHDSTALNRWLDRGFTRFVHWAYFHPFRVMLVSLLAAALSLWYTAENLSFNTSREDLIARDLPFNVLYQNYRQQFEDFDGMIVVVEGDRPDSMSGFANALVDRLKAHHESFDKIFYKVDPDYFKSRALLYLDREELGDLETKLRDHQEFLERVAASPGLNTLLKALNREISTGMVDSLLTDFLGTAEPEETDDTADLGLLIALLEQMAEHLQGEAVYRSPWGAFLNQKANELESEGYLVSDSGRLLFILLNPKETKGDFAGSRDAIEIIRGQIREVRKDFPDVQVGLTGGEVISADEMYTTMRDAQRASRYALVGVALLFILFYRSVIKPMLAVSALVVGIAWSMGWTTLAVGHLNIMSVVFTTILIGLGIDFGIHILCRYREERRLGKDVYTAMSDTLQQTGQGNFSGAVTTAIAFGAMAFTNFIGIIELGTIAAGGILLCLLAMVLLLPSMITVEERWRKPVYCLPERVEKRDTLFEKIYSHYYAIILAALGLLFWAAWVSKDMKFDYNLLHMQAPGTEAVAYEMKIIHDAKRASWNAAIIADSLDDARAKARALKRLPSVGRVESILSALPEEQDKKIARVRGRIAPLIDPLQVAPQNEPLDLAGLKTTLKNIRFKLRKKEKGEPGDQVAEAGRWARQVQENLDTLDSKTAATRLTAFSRKLFADFRQKIADLKASAHPAPVKLEELPESLKNRFLSRDGKYLLLVFPNINIWEREAMEDFLKDLRRIDPNVTGNAVHMFESSRLMIEAYIRGGLYAMAAITLYLLVTFRRARTTLLVLLPTLAGALLTVGLMDLCNIQFNLANLVILPLILGIGVVDGVHIVHRYQEVQDTGANVISKSTGQAVVLTSLTTMIGFGSLMIADHRGVYSLGLVLTLGVGSCLFTSVTLLPALMKLCHAKGWRI